ncbi:PPR domain-containing protein/PPR_2 domain-containing protein/PPR_3 domain-containing protein [Cephalotus follicularis]|uniref:PPR domain-containing protein/PPR_2 domain-containing protein/PPR_3 domain-containing protein n=1 Tax=Cephalotus follicularis TaxID=3775 RepID=A0A1Q3DBA8_CEPFO|nr:PPR domain-containing protein/PPR_2 domain-containing protein/PPR_3 domain-containing protein [Cephalotus follicularis]
MFMELRKCGFEPDDVTMVSVISSCGSLGDLDLALQLHKCVFHAKSLVKSDILMLNSLIDLYGKCGRMDLAFRVFLRMKQRNVSSWTSMIVGYAMHGHVDEALECFCCMREAGVRPNHVTFVGVLSACVHGGKVQEGRRYFDMMKIDYGIMPGLPHFGCIVDLLGRAGLLEEAREIVEGMPVKANVAIWGCLMGACEKYGDVKMGELVAKQLLELEPWNDGVYVVLSNLYASRGMWEAVDRIRGLMKQSKLAKIPAYSLATSSD